MASILTMTGERLALVPGVSYVLGRASGCDIVLHESACSRRHARIHAGKDGKITIEDLRSRNGTWVDDRPVRGPTVLVDHSRIRIGSYVCLVSLVDAGRLSLSSPSSEESCDMTVTMDRRRAAALADGGAGAGRPRIAGQLGAFDLTDVLRLLLGAAADGTLHVASAAGEARIEMRGARPVHAVFRSLVGDEAVRAVLALETGIFWFLDGRAPCESTVGAEPLESLVRRLCPPGWSREPQAAPGPRVRRRE